MAICVLQYTVHHMYLYFKIARVTSDRSIGSPSLNLLPILSLYLIPGLGLMFLVFFHQVLVGYTSKYGKLGEILPKKSSGNAKACQKS